MTHQDTLDHFAFKCLNEVHFKVRKYFVLKACFMSLHLYYLSVTVIKCVDGHIMTCLGLEAEALGLTCPDL